MGDQGAIIHIVGDVTVDWFLSEPEMRRDGALATQYLWEAGDGPGLTANAGGAALDAQLIEAAVGSNGLQAVVSGPTVPAGLLENPGAVEINRTFSIWRRLPRKRGSAELVWRMENFVGWHPARTLRGDLAASVPELDRCALLIEDANMQFRAFRELWDPPLGHEMPANVVIRQTGNLGKGELWRYLIERHSERLTLMCFVGDLRKEGAPIGRPLSWERTAQDVVLAVKQRPDLARAKRVIVVLATSGVVIVDRDEPSLLLYDPRHQEGDWEVNRPGVPFGAGVCAVSAAVVECATNPDSPDLLRASKRGLSAARSLHDGGFSAEPTESGIQVRFPFGRVARQLGADSEELEEIQVAEIQEVAGWRLFDTAFQGSFRDAAEQIARHGVSGAGKEIPIEQMGAWSSVDRIEIESMRSVRNIISEYLASRRRNRPLNLAVFGPPGSGKSFAIKQMASAIATGSDRLTTLEFNLSQFRAPDELPSAFQQVRDQALQQSLPLVFWDEFDSSLNGAELGWLVHFLAPMQDGAFVDEGVNRPIGLAIFVFAGGTHATMDSFKQRAFQLPGAKATDFLSRLRGFVNVLGPNPGDDDDATFPLRRAMLLRSVLQSRAPQLFSEDDLRIDDGILNAFLDVPEYLHGSRSMESVVEMSSISGRLVYERSALPAVHQLALHVDAGAFMRLVGSRETAELR
jgi:ATPase family associated with various cellular activities (AAA)